MTKRVTAADVARSLGLSRATVGFVLNDTPGQSISQATKDRVIAEAQRLGYKPHTAARALASGRSHIALMLLPDWPMDHSIRAHLEEASLVFDQAGYSLVTMTPHPGGQSVPLWESLAPDVVLALTAIPDAQYEAIRATGAATLIPGRDAEGLGRELHFDEGPRAQVAHLLATGRERLAFAASADPRLVALSDARERLAEATLRERSGAGLVHAAPVDASTAGAVVADWVARGVDGVVAYNDDVAALVLGAALRGGVRVPDELAIVGHDDSPLASLLVPSLTSVRVDTAGLGRFIALYALSLVSGSPLPSATPMATLDVVIRETA